MNRKTKILYIIILSFFLFSFNFAYAEVIKGKSEITVKEGEIFDVVYTAEKEYIQISKVATSNDELQILKYKTNPNNPKEATLTVRAKDSGVHLVDLRIIYSDPSDIQNEIKYEIKRVIVKVLEIETDAEDKIENQAITDLDTTNLKLKENEVAGEFVLNPGSNEIKQVNSNGETISDVNQNANENTAFRFIIKRRTSFSK